LKKAVGLTTARGNTERVKSYRQTFGKSNENLKEFVGVLLLRLVAGQAEPSGWQVLDWVLRLLYEGSGL